MHSLIVLEEVKLVGVVQISLENYCELPGDPLQHLLQAGGSSQFGETHQVYFVENYFVLRWISSLPLHFLLSLECQHHLVFQTLQASIT